MGGILMNRFGKGARKYEQWRQGWIARDLRTPLAPECVVGGEEENLRKCGRCELVGREAPMDFIDCEQGHYTVRNMRLALCHRGGRYSHANKKMADDGVFWGCHRCNAEMSGAKFKEGNPQWSSNTRTG